MYLNLLFPAVAGAAGYMTISKIRKMKDDPPLGSQELDYIYTAIYEYRKKHPDCELTDQQLFKAFMPRKL